MFTGIVQSLVTVQSVVDEGDLKRLCLDLGEFTKDLKLGASVAVNGTCLTVTKVEQGTVHFDVIMETIRMTNLGEIEQGDLVNMERSFQIGDEVGGHILSGHVSGTARLLDRDVQGADHVLTFHLDDAWSRYVFHKGFVALDGASLTVSSINRNEQRFSISLIPETLQRTTLGKLQVGESVNVEVDSQSVTTVDTVERLFADPQWRQQVLSSQAEL